MSLFCRRGHDKAVLGRDANGRCKACRNESKARWYKRNTGLTQYRARAWRLQRKYNLSEEEASAIYARGCEICGSHEAINLDHDHATGRVRGCLCHRHNCGLGLFRDSVEELYSAIQYLKKAT